MPSPRPVLPLAASATPPAARPGTRPVELADRRGPRGRGLGLIERAGQAAGTGRPGDGWAASPSAPSRRRTASGSVTARTIRRGPAQRSQMRTPIANTRRRSVAHDRRLGPGRSVARHPPGATEAQRGQEEAYPSARYAARFTNAPISGRRLSTCSGRWPPRFTTRRCTPSSP